MGSDASIWKFLWNSPSSIVACRKKLVAVSKSHIIATPTGLSRSTPWIRKPSPERDASRRIPFRASRPFDLATTPMRTSSPFVQEFESTSTPKTKTDSKGKTSEASLSASVNLRAGLFAGVAAGTTTYVTTANKLFAASAVRGSLFPVLSETVPSVAVFFASYEALKGGVFDVSSDKSTARTFCERFASASMASTLGFVAPAVARRGGMASVQGLLPLRFACFFGTFEMCKDAMNIEHQRLSVSEVASAAAIGGTVSHGLCYPMLERRALCSMAMATTTSASALTSAMYRGWTASLSKFLPSCVACSCAFEYGKRYLTTRND